MASRSIERGSCSAHLSLITDGGFVRELHLRGLQDRVLLQDRGLALVVAEGLLAVQALVEDHADGPHVHFAADLGRVLADHEALGREVPGGDDELESVQP